MPKRKRGNPTPPPAVRVTGLTNVYILRGDDNSRLYLVGEAHDKAKVNPVHTPLLHPQRKIKVVYIEGSRPEGRVECDGSLNKLREYGRTNSTQKVFVFTESTDVPWLHEMHEWAIQQPEADHKTQVPWHSTCPQAAALLTSLNGDVDQVSTYGCLLLHNPSIAALLKKEASMTAFVERMFEEQVGQPHSRHLKSRSKKDAVNKAFFELQRMMGDVFVLLHLHIQRDTTLPSLFYGGGAHVERLLDFLCQSGWSVVWGKVQEPDKGPIHIPAEVLSPNYTGEKTECTMNPHNAVAELYEYTQQHNKKLSRYFSNYAIMALCMVEKCQKTDAELRGTICDMLAGGCHWSPSVASRVMAVFMLLPHDVFRRFVARIYDFVSGIGQICTYNTAYFLMEILHGPPAMQWTPCDADEKERLHHTDWDPIDLARIRAHLASMPATGDVINVPEQTVNELPFMNRLTHECVLLVNGTHYRASNVCDSYTKQLYEALNGKGSYFNAKYRENLLQKEMMSWFFGEAY